ncbi:hypothetical protein D3C84_1312210 [compost metagenome]
MSEAIFLANGEAKILPPFDEVSATASVAFSAAGAAFSSVAGVLAGAAPPAV